MGRGLQEKINKNCKECIFDEKEKGSWRAQVELCEISECEFYDVRPKTIVAERLERKIRVELRQESCKEGSILH